MSLSRQNALAGVPDRYDGLAALAALLVLAYAFLVAFQPLLGLFVSAAFLSVYAVARTGDVEHAAVVAGCWFVVFVGVASLAFVGAFLGGILAVVAYVGWRVVTGRTPD